MRAGRVHDGRRKDGGLGVRDALLNAPYQMLQTGLGGGFVGDRQFEGSIHMRSYRHVQGSLRSASPLVEAFNMAVMDEMFKQYTGYHTGVRTLARETLLVQPARPLAAAHGEGPHAVRGLCGVH